MRLIKYVFISLSLLFIFTLKSIADNFAICLDGKDNNIRTGIGIISPPWSLEVWIKGDEDRWRNNEVIIGGGEYSNINWVDNKPLMLCNGKVHSSGADLWSDYILDKEWHHLAVTCNGHSTQMFIDGELSCSKDTAVSIIPGAIGVEEVEPCFGGLIDEVRIWKECIASEIVAEWMRCPLSINHPNIKDLYAYYPLDDFDGEVSINWVGKGHQAFHIRNGRSDYYGKAKLAFPVKNTNPLFKSYDKEQRLFNAISIHNEWDVDKGQKDAQVVKLRLAVQGSNSPLALQELKLDLSLCSSLKNIKRVHIYSTGSKANSKKWVALKSGGFAPEKYMTLKFKEQSSTKLRDGINYFLVTFDIADNAVVGDTVDAKITDIKINDQNVKPEEDRSAIYSQVSLNSRCNKNILRVLQWNIWHGGVHIANSGRMRVLELTRSSNADIIMMQEAYGIQNMLADSLNYYLRTKSSKDNLALYSRYPIDTISFREPFKSNPVEITLSCGRKVLFVDLWLRYAYNPEYTSGYANKGWDTNQWVKEDSLLALTDIKNIIEKDVKYNIEENMPVIITGDFNSCSHLDWTEKTKKLHYGYGTVNFPVSRYMASQGFIDCFRFLHPDEVNWQCGTISAIWNQMQMARIDFIYYKDNTLKPVSCKVIRTAPNIDDVWPSDHAAVVATFLVE